MLSMAQVQANTLHEDTKRIVIAQEVSEILERVKALSCKCSDPYCGERYVLNEVIDIIKEYKADE
jgi:uncharacterized Zn-finger protein